ncbi:LOW QUALITY PROTEIN: Hypothetical protein PHPALM_15943, partial [Phytophthora palmivora]
MRFPLPVDTFPSLVVSEEDQFDLQKLSDGFIYEAIEEYNDFRYTNGGVLDKERWKVVKCREGVTSYRDLRMIDPERSRSAPKERVGSSTMTASTKLFGVLAIGTIEGEFNDMAFGLINGSTEMLKIKSSYTNDKIADAKVLAVIVEPTPTEPVRGTYLKWSVSTGAPFLLRRIVRPRDFVYLESIGILKMPSGERIGYSLIHSLQIPNIRELTEYQIVRANVSICALFRQKASGKIELYVKGFVDAMGNIHSSIAVSATADGLISFRKIVHCGQMKKLNWMLKTKKTVILDHGRLRGLYQLSMPTEILSSLLEHHVLSLQRHKETELSVSNYTSGITTEFGVLSFKADALEIATEELIRQNPFDFYEVSTKSTPSSKMVSPSSTNPPDNTTLMPSEDDTDDVLEIRENEDGNDSSSLSSYDSEEFGLVARKGFARMYVLSRNMQPTDEKDSKGDSSKHGDWNLLYASGQHYFHGPIQLPEDIHVRDEAEGEQNRPTSFFESISRQHDGGVELVDIPRLLPLLHAQQDSLTAVDDVVELSSEQRDAVYQMHEVGEFFVEELAKPRTTERLERGSRELPWLAEATENNNPAFFELQTHPNTNNELANAGVRLIVMKLVIRGVLLDIIYSRDSYFATLRENVEEIALEDTFVPNVASAGPCYLVRRYSDEDLKQLLLWCPLPTNTSSSLSLHQSSITKTSSPGGKSRRVLAANDTQLYCLIAKRPQTRKNAKTTKKKKNSSTDSKRNEDDGDADDESEDLVNDAVVFQFNQFVYHGSAQLPTSILDDAGALTARGFPLLRAQASDLAFAGVYEELLGPGGEHEAEFPRTKFLSRFATIHKRLQDEVGSVLLDLLVGAQKWVSEFMKEVPTA